MTNHLKTGVLTALFFLPGVAFAQAAMDTDGDGMVSMDEFQAAMPDASTALFAEIDTDGDGLLSETELAAAQDAGLLPS